MYRCSGLRGLNEWLDEAGNGFYFSFFDENGRQWDAVFPNIGQPDPSPIKYKHHIDNPDIYDRIFIHHFSTQPFFLSYSLDIELKCDVLQDEKELVFHITSKHPFRVHPVGTAPDLNVQYNENLSGSIELSLSGRHTPDAIRARIEAHRKTSPDQPWAASVVLNQTQSPLLAAKTYVPVNKTWVPFIATLFDVKDHGNLMLVPWDGACASMILAHCDADAGWQNLSAIFEGIQSDGRIPQIHVGNTFSNRSNPPIWFLAAAELYKNDHNPQKMMTLIPHLLANYRWFKASRMHPASSPLAGTFSWGTDESTQTPELAQTKGKYGAMMESGLDDSPIFSGMNLSGGLLNHACIDLTCLMAVACELLIHWSADTVLAPSFTAKDREELQQDWTRFPASIQSFFDATSDIPNSCTWRDAGLHWVKTVTPLSFYPLLTPFISPQQTAKLAELYRTEFLNDSYPEAFLPSVSYGDASFDGDGDYWRGRIWPPMVFLTARGFQRHHQDTYQDIKKRATHMLTSEWKRHGHVHENYSGTTGQGEPQPGVYARSCPLYSWGGLLGIL